MMFLSIDKIVAVLAAISFTTTTTDAFGVSVNPSCRRFGSLLLPSASASSASSASATLQSSASDSDFSAFADSLEQEPSYDDDTYGNNDPWQVKLETLLDPRTSVAQRQIMASELLSANEDIRESVLTALRDRKIDSLLTPTGKRLQDGTRAVARQLTTDIFPKVLDSPRTVVGNGVGGGSGCGSGVGMPQPPPQEILSLLPKIGSRVLNALGNQAKKQLEDLQGDLADPSRIPQRLTQQSQELAQEARNVFLETPEGLEGPSYSVLSTTDEYEIRDYEGYTVASTTMNQLGEDFSLEDVASSGAAFNALAAYLFGANTEGRAMDMTTPVTTTSLGEMRFYLKQDGTINTFPEPLLEESVYDTGSVQLVDIPPARLAVKRFTGFVTEGEVSRQKQALLSALDLDGWELDVPHGAVVPHVIFQYNPPYTLPMVRRNEIAVPIQTDTTTISTTTEMTEEYDYDYDEEDVSPSDY
eukprot:CAMPEP_0116543816 /NCGR_PEP_ID=MMETSP0397-20121206/1775_1 /TAXON_ID=216820 /ORGANISM="Cyclophora tenuis, Strain ECT3854" /LENGTH=471 /DNA_ID=CAMNT_0004067965 /DNA_START=52 /DNA_END=1467 /DNA_ORIENTATION=-